MPDFEFHLSDGNYRSERVESDGNFHRIGFVSYLKHIPRYALVVHHAGTGVLAHTLAAGKPAVLLPLEFDQFDYAARLEVAGVATRLRDLRRLSTTIRRTLNDTSIRDACKRVQRELASISAEDRVADLVATFFQEQPR